MGSVLDNLYSSANRIQRQIEEEKRRNNAIQVDIDRLQKAYNQLKSLKNNEVKQLKKDVKRKNCIGTVSWRGIYKVWFDKTMDGKVKDEANNFEKKFDEMLDQISRIKSKKQSEKTSGLGIINKLRVNLDGIKTEIQNINNL